MALHRHSAARRAQILGGVGRELKTNPPKVLAQTRRKKGKAQANRQGVAILLSKAERRGA